MAVPTHPVLVPLLGAAEGILALVFLVSSYVNRSRIRSIFRHPSIFLIAWLVATPALVAAFGLDLLPVAVGLAGGVVGALCHPAFGVGLLMVNLLIRPWEAIDPGNPLEILPRGLAALCVFSWILEKLRQRNTRIVVDTPILTFVALTVWLFVSAAVSMNSSDSLAYVLAAVLPASVVIFVTRNVLIEDWCIRLGAHCFYLAAVIMAICALVLTGNVHFLLDPGVRLESFGQWGNSNDLAALFAAALPICLMRFCLQGSVLRRLCMGILPAAVLSFSLLLTQSRGGIFALIAGCVPFVYERRKRPIVLLGGIFSVIIVIVFASVVFSRESGDLEGSQSSRLNYAVVGLRMVKSSPLVGVGPGNYPPLYESYSTVFDEFGQRTAHSSWVLVMAEAGIPGLLLFAALVWMALKKGWKARAVYPDVLATFLAYFISVSFLSQTYALCTYFLIALSLAAGSVVQAYPALTSSKGRTAASVKSPSGTRRSTTS